MSKKNFRGGMVNMLEESLQGLNIGNTTQETPEQKIPTIADYDRLKAENEILNRELKLWRTGKLNPNTFLQSLSENNLKYDQTTNQIEELE